MNLKRSFSYEALSDLFNVCHNVHGAGSAASAKSQLNWSCACKAKARILQKKTVLAKAAKRPFEAWYEMYVKPWHPELAMVDMRVLSSYFCVLVSAKLVCSLAHPLEDWKQAGACNHWEACKCLLKQQNGGSDSLCYQTQDACWAVHLMKMHTPQMILLHTILRADHSPAEAWVAESPSFWVAHFSRVAE